MNNVQNTIRIWYNQINFLFIVISCYSFSRSVLLRVRMFRCSICDMVTDNRFQYGSVSFFISIIMIIVSLITEYSIRQLAANDRSCPINSLNFTYWTHFRVYFWKSKIRTQLFGACDAYERLFTFSQDWRDIEHYKCFFLFFLLTFSYARFNGSSSE